MIGIVHHNPVIISVILDRERFKKQLISTSDIRDESWVGKVEKFSSSPRDGRTRILFVEKLANLQTMLRQGFDASPFKIVVYDDCDVLKHVIPSYIVDAEFDLESEVWELYKLLPEHLNKALANTPAGVDDGIIDFDFSQVEDPIKTSAPEQKKKKKAQTQEHGNPMAETNALMKDLLEGDGLAPESSPPVKPQALSEPEPEPAPEPEPEPVKEPEPEPEQKSKPEPKAAPKPETPKPKREKPKAAALESYKLF